MTLIIYIVSETDHPEYTKFDQNKKEALFHDGKTTPLLLNSFTKTFYDSEFNFLNPFPNISFASRIVTKAFGSI